MVLDYKIIDKVNGITDNRRRFFDELVVSSSTFRIVLKLLYIIDLGVKDNYIVINYNYRFFNFLISEDLVLEYVDNTPVCEDNKRRFKKR